MDVIIISGVAFFLFMFVLGIFSSKNYNSPHALGKIDAYCFSCSKIFDERFPRHDHPLMSELVCLQCKNEILQEIKDKELLAKHTKDNLTIIERAEVAKAALHKFDYVKIDNIREFLTDEEHLHESIKLLHDSLKDEYAIQIEKKGMLKERAATEIWDEEISICMAMGEQTLFNSSRIKNFHTASTEPVVNKNNIEKTHSWKELQGRDKDK